MLLQSFEFLLLRVWVGGAYVCGSNDIRQTSNDGRYRTCDFRVEHRPTGVSQEEREKGEKREKKDRGR